MVLGGSFSLGYRLIEDFSYSCYVNRVILSTVTFRPNRSLYLIDFTDGRVA